MREALEVSYARSVPLLEQLGRRLEEETRAAVRDLPHVDRVSFRVKTADSFLKKALDPGNQPPYQTPLVEIEDQVAGRVIVFFLEDIELVKERLRETYTFVESSRRRPPKDEEFGYESHHLVCVIPPQVVSEGWMDRDDLPKTFELQIRTLFMHAWAEPQHDLAYKGSDDLSKEAKRELAWIAASAWGADQALERVKTATQARQ